MMKIFNSKKGVDMPDWSDAVIGIVIFVLVFLVVWVAVLKMESAKNEKISEITQEIDSYSALYNFLRTGIDKESLTPGEKSFIERYNIQNNADLLNFMVIPPWSIEETERMNLARGILEKNNDYFSGLFETDYLSRILMQDTAWEITAAIEPVEEEYETTIIRSCEIKNEECKELSRTDATAVYVPLQQMPGKVMKVSLITQKKVETWYS